MGKTINISDKLNSSKPVIIIGEKSYEINDTMETVFKFEELAGKGNKGIMDALKMALGDKSYKELKIEQWSIDNFKVLTTALLASMQGLTYEEAEARFQKQLESI